MGERGQRRRDNCYSGREREGRGQAKGQGSPTIGHIDGGFQARVEADLTKALNSLAAAEEGGHRLEGVISSMKAELARVDAEQTSLLLELEASKGEVSSLHARVEKDREDMVKDYQGFLELIFAYGYGCCVFKKNICGDQPDILDGMPDSANPLPLDFFINLRCPLALATIEAKDAEVVTPQFLRVPLTICQPAEFLWILGDLIPHCCVPFIRIHIFTKIG